MCVTATTVFNSLLSHGHALTGHCSVEMTNYIVPYLLLHNLVMLVGVNQTRNYLLYNTYHLSQWLRIVCTFAYIMVYSMCKMYYITILWSGSCTHQGQKGTRHRGGHEPVT